MTIPILKALLVLVILAVMIIVLVTINHYFAGGLDCGSEDDIDGLRRDIYNSDDVISDESVFRNLVEKPVRVDENRRNKMR